MGFESIKNFFSVFGFEYISLQFVRERDGKSRNKKKSHLNIHNILKTEFCTYSCLCIFWFVFSLEISNGFAHFFAFCILKALVLHNKKI